MDFITSFYKDPLFSIIVIIAIIVLITIADTTKNRFKNKAKKNALQAIANSFKHYGIDDDIRQLMDISKYSTHTLKFIANIHVTGGNFDEAIKIYLSILEKIKDIRDKLEVLELLGIAYYKAGFIQRAKNIFIEILKHNHRNINALFLLMQSYELLGDYKNAVETISCLEELDVNVTNIKQYMQILKLINDNTIGLKQKEEEILKINTNFTDRITLNYFKNNNISKFWELIINNKNIENYIDILWNLPPYDLNEIKKYKGICDIYRAKGIINDNIKCNIFELETLRVLNKHSDIKGELGFKYRCITCQGIYPFETYKCPSCRDIGNIKLILEIMENKNEKNYSLL